MNKNKVEMCTDNTACNHGNRECYHGNQDGYFTCSSVILHPAFTRSLHVVYTRFTRMLFKLSFTC